MSTAILLDGISKKYYIGQRNTYRTIRDGVGQILRGKRNRYSRATVGQESIWALRNVNFEVQPGEIVAIIGSNGAGKSTLLKILSRITDPTEGIAEIRGRLQSLLEVGTGFHPELTGRENVFLNGAILGMSRAETQSKFDGIVAFAEIEKFIDTPVKHYSSGMYVRLAFAVAAHLDPDVMIIDEVLAVGDAAFQRKCLARIGEVGSSGKTVLFVSHNLSSVQHLCTRGIVLEAGSVVFDGLVQEAVTHYLQSVSANGAATGSHVVDLRSAGPHKTRIKPVLKELVLFHGNGLPLDGSLPMGGSLRAHLVFDLDATGHKYDACVAFDNLMGQRVFTAHTLFEPSRSWQGGQGQKGLVCEIPSLPLLPGEYKVKVGVNIDGEEIDFIEDVTRIQVSSCDYYGTGVLPWNGEFVAPHHWRPLPNPQITPI